MTVAAILVWMLSLTSAESATSEAPATRIVSTTEELVALYDGKTERVTAAWGVYEVTPPLMVDDEIEFLGPTLIVATGPGEITDINHSALVKVRVNAPDGGPVPGLTNVALVCRGHTAIALSVEATYAAFERVYCAGFYTKGVRIGHAGKSPQLLTFKRLRFRSGETRYSLVAFQCDPGSKPAKRLVVENVEIGPDDLAEYRGKSAVAWKLAQIDHATMTDFRAPEHRWVFGENVGTAEVVRGSYGADPEFYPDTIKLRSMRVAGGLMPRRLITRDVEQIKRFAEPDWSDSSDPPPTGTGG